jgi:acetyl-CoA synthetase
MADQTATSSELEVLLETEQTFEPPPEFAAEANAADPGVYERADSDPEAWWASWAEKLDWIEPWNQILDWSEPPFAKWFVGGKLNASANCLDRHVAAGRGDRVAIHWEAEDADELGDQGRKAVTYADLLDSTQRFANALKGLGVGKGDVVGIYMPMVPEAVAAMLACARIGAIHNVVFGGFSAESVKERMAFSEAKALVTADATLRRGEPTPMKEKVDEILGDLPKLEHVVVVDRCGTNPPMTEGRDVFWHEAVAEADAECEPEAMDAEDPLYILYTSGSTAKPKGILHTTGGYLTQVTATHKLVFDLKDSDVYWCAADIGWVTGHSYIVYGPLANGATSVMYEGAPNYPAEDRWWEIVERYGVTIFYTAPTAIRACMKWGTQHPEAHDLSSLRLLGSVGEPINPRAWLWYREHIGGGRCPIVDTWWQTETGAIMITPLPGLTTTKPGSATVPFPGIRAAIYDSEGEEIDEGAGTLMLTRPWPAMTRGLYKERQRFIETYWVHQYRDDTYLVGDAARRDEDGYFWIVGRIDDVINVSGHRLSTMEVESAIVSHPKVAEAAVIGRPDEDTGQAIVAFVTPEGDNEGDEELEAELREHVATKIGKLARPKEILFADDLPKTRSGKIMRRLLRDIAAGNELGDVTTLRDPSVVERLQQQVAADGG